MWVLLFFSKLNGYFRLRRQGSKSVIFEMAFFCWKDGISCRYMVEWAKSCRLAVSHFLLKGVMLHSALFCRGPFRGGNVVGIINILPGYCWDSLLVSKQEIKKDRPHGTA